MFKRFQNRDYATKEGYQARLTGAPVEKNPYPEDSKNWKDWKAAWHYADHLVERQREERRTMDDNYEQRKKELWFRKIGTNVVYWHGTCRK